MEEICELVVCLRNLGINERQEFGRVYIEVRGRNGGLRYKDETWEWQQMAQHLQY